MKTIKTIFGLGAIQAASVLRVLMAPLPNIEPVMLFTLSGALAYGPIFGFFIGFTTMLLSDIYLHLAGSWTIYTTISYGIVGFLAGLYGVYRGIPTRAGMVLLAFALTIMYDVITMIGFAFNFMVPLQVAAVNQIPFTLLHVIGNTVLAFVFAPSLARTMQKAYMVEPMIGKYLFGRWILLTKRRI